MSKPPGSLESIKTKDFEVSTIPTKSVILWSGTITEGKLILATDPGPQYGRQYKVYFRIESADMYLEGAIMALTGVHTADDFILEVISEWAQFIQEYRDEYSITVH